jgi:hypothetical protein
VNEGQMDRFEQAIKEVLALYDSQQNLHSGLKSEQQYLMQVLLFFNTIKLFSRYGLYLMFLLAKNKIAEFHMV